MDIKDFLVQELLKLPWDRGLHFKNDTAWIRCFNPDHAGGNERTPSMVVNLAAKPGSKGGTIPPGCITCFGCSYKGGWHDLAERYHLKQLEGLNVYRESVGEIINERDRTDLLGSSGSAGQTPADAIPWPPNLKWRTIAGPTVNAVGGLLYYDFSALQPRCLFPVNIDEEMVGYVRANTVVGKKGNYFNSPGGWAKEKGLFPYDYVANNLKGKHKVLYLVEGPRDALNLIQHGSMALALLGAGNSWSESKAHLIEDLDPDLLVLMLDNDDAGRIAASRIAKSLKHQVPIVYFKFPVKEDGSKFDASDLQIAQVKQLERRYEKGLKAGKYQPATVENFGMGIGNRRKQTSPKGRKPAWNVEARRASLLK